MKRLSLFAAIDVHGENNLEQWLTNGGMIMDKASPVVTLWLYYEAYVHGATGFVVEETNYGQTNFKNAFADYNEALEKYKRTMEKYAVGIAMRALGID